MALPDCRILLIDDEPEDVRFVRRLLAGVPGIRFAIEQAGSLDEGIRLHANRPADVVLLDLSLPDGAGLETLERFLGHAHGATCVVLTGHDDAEAGLEAVRRGAQDYLVKGRIDSEVLARSIRYAIERHQLLQIKEDYLKVAAHDFRSPLTAILMAVEILKSESYGEKDERTHYLLNTIQKLGKDLLKLADDFLDVERFENVGLDLRPKVVDLRLVLESRVQEHRLVAGARSITVALRAGAEPARLSLDPDRFQQVLNNLLANALKHTRDGGRIELVLERLESGVHLVVRDDGEGIPAEALERIFEKYEQLRPGYRGAGLGLAICKRIVDAHGGEIWAESEGPGRGAAFHITLPAAPCGPDPSTTATSGTTRSRSPV